MNSAPAEEADRRQQDERNGELLFVGVEPGRDEQPDLIHDHRRGEDDAGDQRDLDVEAEGFARLGVDHLAAGRQQTARRAEQEVGDAVDEGEADHHADGDRQQRVDDALPELVEMLQKGHLPAGGFIVFLGENTGGGPG